MTSEFQLLDGGDAVTPETTAGEQPLDRIAPDAPDADALEQAAPADPAEAIEPDDELPFEADPADAADQRRAVPGVNEYE